LNEVFLWPQHSRQGDSLAIDATSATPRQRRFGPFRGIFATVYAIEGPGITHSLGIHNGPETREKTMTRSDPWSAKAPPGSEKTENPLDSARIRDDTYRV